MTGARLDTASSRFWSKVSGGDVAECWEWTGARINGYGFFTLSRGKSTRAHRFAYQTLVGPIPGDLVLDHLCRNRACVNPWHLEPVTITVNNRRGLNCRATDDLCANGHPWESGAAYARRRGVLERYCRPCWETSHPRRAAA